jgi:hypothetical protein
MNFIKGLRSNVFRQNITINSSKQRHAIDTKAVVILYGWVGATPRNLQKYAELYTNNEHYKCATIYGTASTPSLMTRYRPTLRAVVMESVRKAAATIREVEASSDKSTRDTMTPTRTKKEIPILLHYFSNGGTFLAVSLNELIKDAVSGRIKEQDGEDLMLLNERLKRRGHEIVDSAPAYIYEATSYRVVDESVPNLPLKIMIKSLIFLSLQRDKLLSYFRGKDDGIYKVFWNDVLESDLCPRQAFVYSTIDHLTDSKKVDEYIEERKKRGIDVTAVLKFEDSGHVMHMRKHPKEYKEKLVDCVLERTCGGTEK